MRKAVWATLAIVGGLALAGNARAQTGFGVDPTQLSYTPVNTVSGSAIPIAQPMRIPVLGISLPSFFSSNKVATGTPVVGSSNFPTQAQMPGMAYLSYFGYQRLTGAK